MKIQNQQNLKSNNEKMILEIIRNNNEKDISQADIVKATKMSPTSISRIVENLITKGLVKKKDLINTDKVGRVIRIKNGKVSKMTQNAHPTPVEEIEW